VLGEASWSPGQFGPVPVQNSATSHAPAATRHWKVSGRKESLGQKSEFPEQVSATSHTSTAARQTVPAGFF
jgi:hypothetical protein